MAAFPRFVQFFRHTNPGVRRTAPLTCTFAGVVSPVWTNDTQKLPKPTISCHSPHLGLTLRPSLCVPMGMDRTKVEVTLLWKR